ncbi:MAG TPA: glycosyltransferase [Pseudonocardiaceae bacterium]
MDEKAAASWNVEYAAGRYRNEPPVGFIEDILAASRRHGLTQGLCIGCGNGRNLIPLLAGGLDLLGLDVSTEAITQLYRQRPDRANRLIIGDVSALPAHARYELVIGIQVFQHGTRHQAHQHLADAAARVAPGGLLCVRVNSTDSDIDRSHQRFEDNDDGSFTLRYLAGPKTGLNIHFFTADELREVVGTSFTEDLPPHRHSTPRTPPAHGQWSQWQAIWQRRSACDVRLVSRHRGFAVIDGSGLMRILIVTAGSRGDVAPFTGLGQRLQRAGHQVALAAHGLFADLVRECGLEYRPLPGDPVELARARTAAPSAEAGRSVFASFLDRLGDGVIEAAAAGTDMLLTAFGPAPVSRLVAEGFGIPSLGAYLAPAVPTQQFPPPGWPGAGDLGPARRPRGGPEAARPGRFPLRRDPAAAADPARPARRHHPGAGRRRPAGWLADLPRLQSGGAAAPCRLARGGTRERVLVARPAAAMAAPGPAGRLPAGRTPSGVRRLRQHDPNPGRVAQRHRRRSAPPCGRAGRGRVRVGRAGPLRR